MKERVQQKKSHCSGYVAAFIQVTKMNVVARGSPRQMEACPRLTPAQFRFSQPMANTPLLETA
jgi:hypothetical protein